MATNGYPGPDTVRRRVLDNGLILLTYENPSSHTVVVDGLLRTGALAEPDDKAGLADFTADLLTRGTRTRDFDAIYETLESLGAGLSFGSSRHTSGFYAYSLAEDFDTVLDLLVESLRFPTFPAEHVELVRGQTITGLQMRANDTRRTARLTFGELAYPNHPYRRSVSGYIETISAISRDDLADFHARNYGPTGAIVTVVGAIDGDAIARQIERAFGDWRSDGQPALPAVPDAPRPDGIQRRYVSLPEKHQCDIVLGLPGPPRAAADYLDLSLMNTILGVFGMMGRIGQKVREEKGLAYYAGSGLEGGLGPGAWSASAGVAPDKVDEAIDAVLEEIRRVMDEPVTAEELADSQAYRTGSLPMSLETNAGIADVIGDIELYDLGLDYLERYRAEIESITPARIQDAARKYLSTDDLAIAVCGPEPV